VRFVVLGCGSVGSNLAMALMSDGHQVNVIERKASERSKLPKEFSGRFIIGIGIDLNTLREAEIERADGFAAVTADDSANLAAAMVARKQFRVPHVVARVTEPNKLNSYELAGIQVVCPPAWGAKAISGMLTRRAQETVLEIGHGEVKVVAVRIGPRGRNARVKDVTSPPSILAIALVRNGMATIPMASTELLDGDTVYVRVPDAEATRFQSIVQILEE